MDILLMGWRWQVRNGQLIDTWKDRWLNKPPTYKAHCSEDVQPTRSKMATLIDNTRQWDVHTIRELIHPDDVDYVLQIPLSTRSQSDMLMWNETNSGMLTVQSIGLLHSPSVSGS
ncbi:hypothetical protein REPUB_Repub08aG0105000 [Reevesia pubescens]